MTTTPFNEIRRVEQIKAELRARDEFEQAKVARGRELTAELTARAEAKTHERYLAGGDPPAKLVGLTDAGKHVLELEQRIAAADACLSNGLVEQGSDHCGPLYGAAVDARRILQVNGAALPDYPQRIARAITVAEGSKYDDDGELISGFDDIIDILRGEEA
jgi:hypothetical protein